MRTAVVMAVCLGAISPARADDLFPTAARAIPLGDSASRDAPVVELAYGPTFQASGGGEFGIVHRARPTFDYRLSLYGLVAAEVETTSVAPPAFVRTLVGLTASFALKAPAAMGGIVEVSIGVGDAYATTLGTTEALASAQGDIPFGGGGLFLLPEIAWRRDYGAWQLTLRVSERIDLPTLFLIFDERMLADVVADFVGDSFTNVPAVDATLRWRVTQRWQPLLSIHGDVLFPEDPTARTGWFMRGILGLAMTGIAGEFIPFVSADVGNGQGLLINDREARFSVGVRYAAL